MMMQTLKIAMKIFTGKEVGEKQWWNGEKSQDQL